MQTFNGIECEIVFKMTEPKPEEEDKDLPDYWHPGVLGGWSGKAKFNTKEKFEAAKDTVRNDVQICGQGANIAIFGNAIVIGRNDYEFSFDFVGNGVPLRKNGKNW